MVFVLKYEIEPLTVFEKPKTSTTWCTRIYQPILMIADRDEHSPCQFCVATLLGLPAN